MTTVVILAGGLATRLHPVTKRFPKALIEINGRPFIDYQLHLLKTQGLTDIIMCLGHEGKQVEDHLGSGEKIGMKIRYSYDGPTLLGTGGAVRKTLALATDPFFVTYGDAYLRDNYPAILRYFKELNETRTPKAVALMTVYRNENQHDRSNVVFSDGVLKVYDKRAQTSDMRYIDWGLGLLGKKAFDVTSPDMVFDLADIYTMLVDEGLMVGYEVFERFHEVGSFSGIEEFKGSAPVIT
jgi:N-acetyl-alpha-D-muramate 1-phosphate uridylyltransferase